MAGAATKNGDEPEADGASGVSTGLLLRLLCAAPFVCLALVVILSGVAADRAWPAGALLFLGLLISVVPPTVWREMLANLENASIGPVSFALRRDVSQAAADAAEVDTGEGPQAQKLPLGKAKTMFDLRIRLEFKLAYVAKHLLAPADDEPTYINVGSLVFDGYLTEADGRTAIGILSTRQEELDQLSESSRSEFLAEAGRFVESVRASIFWGQVKRCLEGKDRPDDDSLFLTTVETTGRRDDLLAQVSRERGVRVAPALALDRDSSVLRGAKERLARESAKGPRMSQIIVIPDRSETEEEEGGEGAPRVVKLARLRHTLEAT